MTVTGQVKILNRKIKQNEAQYDLEREAAKISALCSNNLDKYECFTGEDLDLKPSTVDQAKFKYSPLGKVFNKGLSKDYEKEGLFKRLKNIEDKNEDQGKKQLEEIKNINASTKPLKVISFFSTISEKAKKIMDNIKVTDNWLENAQLICTKTDGITKYDFTKFIFHDYTIQRVEDNQQDLKILINRLNNDYNPTNKLKIKEKDNTLKFAGILYSIRKDIIDAFEKGIFSYIDGLQIEKETDEEMETTIMPGLESEKSAAKK